MWDGWFALTRIFSRREDVVRNQRGGQGSQVVGDRGGDSLSARVADRARMADTAHVRSGVESDLYGRVESGIGESKYDFKDNTSHFFSRDARLTVPAPHKRRAGINLKHTICTVLTHEMHARRV